MNEFNKATGYKINTQKSLAFLQTNMKIQKEKLRKQSHSSLQQKNKIHRNKPTYRDKNLYAENYKTLMKETKDEKNRWRDTPCSWIGRISIVRMTILPKAIYRFNAICIKVSVVFSRDENKKFHNLYGNTKASK